MEVGTRQCSWICMDVSLDHTANAVEGIGMSFVILKVLFVRTDLPSLLSILKDLQFQLRFQGNDVILYNNSLVLALLSLTWKQTMQEYDRQLERWAGSQVTGKSYKTNLSDYWI